MLEIWRFVTFGVPWGWAGYLAGVAILLAYAVARRLFDPYER